MTSFFNNYSPATGEKIGEIQIAQAEDIDSAVKAAQEGYKIWSAMSGTERGRVLTKASYLIRAQVKELAELEVLDTGKPISEALQIDIPSAADAVEYYAGLAATIHGHHYNLGKSFAYLCRESLGVCVGIGAWNFPFQIACWKSAPALACGNAMIFKPSELTPLSAQKLEQIYLAAGLPKGVFQVVQGQKETGELLSKHSGIKKISVTGSVSTGKQVMSNASETLKHVSLELGGKSPLIIFDDCGLQQAVSAAMAANFYCQGEICSNGTRVFVHEKIYAQFIDMLLPRVAKIKIGNPFAPDTQMGALISPVHLEKVLKYIELGKREGAELIYGGTRPKWGMDDAKLKNGNFLTPAVFTKCQDDMTHVQEEIFGPVMSILTFKDESEVVARANKTPFGLAAGVMTKDMQRAHRVVSMLEAGVCWINNYNVTPVEVPFGGYKLSGIGRENGLATIESYTQLKTVYVEMDQIEVPF